MAVLWNKHQIHIEIKKCYLHHVCVFEFVLVLWGFCFCFCFLHSDLGGGGAGGVGVKYLLLMNILMNI